MSYEVRLRRIVGGRLTVAICLDGHVLAETQLDPRTPQQKAANDINVPPFDIGEMPSDIPLKKLAPASVGMTVEQALARTKTPRPSDC